MDAETHNILASGPYTICVRLLLISWSQQLSKNRSPRLPKVAPLPKFMRAVAGFAACVVIAFPLLPSDAKQKVIISERSEKPSRQASRIPETQNLG